jgi:hypothetical protein
MQGRPPLPSADRALAGTSVPRRRLFTMSKSGGEGSPRRRTFPVVPGSARTCGLATRNCNDAEGGGDKRGGTIRRAELTAGEGRRLATQ